MASWDDLPQEIVSEILWWRKGLMLDEKWIRVWRKCQRELGEHFLMMGLTHGMHEYPDVPGVDFVDI